MRHAFAVVALLGAMPVALAQVPQAPPAQPPIPAAARADRINLNFRATPIEEVFDMLSRKDNVNIILSKGVSGTVSVNLYNVTVREAIYRVAEAAGYWVEERSGDYVIVSR